MTVTFIPDSRRTSGNSGVSARDALRSAGLAARLVWTAAPLSCVATLLLTVISGITPAANAWLLRAVLDALTGNPAKDRSPAPAGVMAGHVMAIAIALGGVALVTATMPYARQYMDSELRRRVGLLMQDNVYRAINAFPGMSRFESPRFADKLQLSQQAANGMGTLTGSVLGIAQGLLTAVTLGLALYVISPAIAGLVAISAVPAIWALLGNSSRRAGLSWRTSPNARRQLFYARLLADHAAAKEIRLFGLGDFLRGRMLGEMRTIQRGERALDRRLFRVESMLALLSTSISAGGLIWIISRVANHELPIGDVTLFAAAVLGVQSAISGVTGSFAQLAQSMLIVSHYRDVVSLGPDLPLAAEPRPVPPLRRGIVLHDVWFRYDEGHPWVLRGLNMTIPAGAAVAVVGLNGAGKSTLVKLLCRFYDPVRGSITWDGMDIRDADPAELRQHIGTVFQDYMTYDLPAAENIGIGDLARLADRDRIRAAAERAGADEAISRLPRGYDTLLSRIFFSGDDQEDPEVGVSLSGGQWQRLALARGLMRADRDLLILDEPSSVLDAEAESAIHHQLRAVRAGRTSLLISHRLGTLRDATIIYVVASGQVMEQGTHDTLMAASGEYHRLFTLQGSGYQQQTLRPWPLSRPAPLVTGSTGPDRRGG